MRIFKQKITIHLVITLIKILTFIKRSIAFFFLIILKFLKKIGGVLFQIIILPIYKFYLPIKKRFQKFFQESSKNKFFFLVTHPKSINVLIILLAILVASANINAGDKQQSTAKESLPFILFNGEEEITEEAFVEEGVPLENYFSNAEAIKPLLQIEEEKFDLEAENVISFFNDSYLFKPFTSVTQQTPRSRTSIETYVVQLGDTIGEIAEKFNLWVSTILWENNLSSYSIIKPGQELTILPVNGITYKIKKGDTLDSIAKKYKSESTKIIDLNKLASANDLEIGKILIIPDGKKYIAPIIKKVSSQSAFASGNFKGHTFPWGQCTWYVAQKRYVPWSGHAKNWLANARRMGFEIGTNPLIGAIICLKETGWQARLWGHVAYVEEVNGNNIIISEMNYKGVGVYSKRTLPINSKKIIGYIY
ncbi:MAG: putative CHAP domain containing protein [Parcubacteria group bacterium Athens1014_10]|nr:MAG: putative CHAP domain containing protein [Parcubacteria group bacterium Athens1014_10]TSD05907.1 MAG: putative CHAP domain containing protein [Parcubacteria group bacterium Athens0714_12]